MENLVTLLRTDSDNRYFIDLVVDLDDELKIRDGDEHDFFDQYNHLDDIRNVVVLLDGGIPVACGAFRQYTEDTVEIKRMYVPEEHRGKGYATRVVKELEEWAKQCGYTNAILETGVAMPEAIALYSKCGYSRIPNYGPYKEVANSVCFSKQLVPVYSK